MGEKKPYFDELDDVSADDVVIATEAQFDETTTSRTGATALRWVLTLIVFFLFAGMGWLTWSLAPVVVGALASAVLFSCMHVVLEWERSVVLRFGKFNRVAGPGLVFTWPIIEFYTLRIDQRVATTYFGAEETLTSDLVPINVDAVLFWMVFSAKKACVEVEDYSAAVAWVAQTAMRKAIGRATVAEVAMRRDQLDAELKDAIEEKLSPWDPICNGWAEKDISEMLKDASEVYAGDQDAMKLRTMHLAYESVEQSGGTLVIPSAFSEGFAPEAGGAATAGRPAAGE